MNHNCNPVVIFLLALAVISLSATAQTVEYDLPAVAALPTGVGGDSVTWVVDMDGITGSHKRIVDRLTADSTMVSELKSRKLLLTRNGVIHEAGFENRSIRINFSDPIATGWLQPIYGDSLCGRFSASGIYYEQLGTAINGDYYTKVDGRGAIVAGNKRFDNVVRVHHHRQWLQLLSDDKAKIETLRCDGPPAADSLTSGETLTGFIHDSWTWIAAGAHEPLAEAVRYAAVDPSGAEVNVVSYNILNIPGDFGSQEEEEADKPAPAQLTEPGDNPAFVEAVSATLSADGASVEIDLTVTVAGADNMLSLGVFDPAGRQMGQIVESTGRPGPLHLTVPLTMLPENGQQLLLSIQASDGQSLVYKVNR